MVNYLFMDTRSYVAVMQWNGRTYAVRGGSTTGPWSLIEVQVVGRRLQDEIGGTYVQAMETSMWDLTVLRTDPISAAAYIQMAGGSRTTRQYKADPLVVDPSSEV